jgi:hypothetical protein
MQLNRIIIIWLALCGIVCAEGLRNRFGIYTNGQTLATGRVAVSTNPPVKFFVGNVSSQAVLVGSAEMATTGDVAAATGGVTTNLTLWDGSTNLVLCITNGLIKGVTTP